MVSAVKNCRTEIQSVDAVATRMTDVSALIIHVLSFIRQEVKRSPLKKAEIEKRVTKMGVAVEKRNIKEVHRIPTNNMGSVRSLSPARDVCNDKKINSESYCILTFWINCISTTIKAVDEGKLARAVATADILASPHPSA